MGNYLRPGKKEVGQWDFKIAKVCAFYGWTFCYTVSLPLDVFNKMHDSIGIMEAQEFLRQTTLNSWPEIKKEDRDRIHREVHRKAYPRLWSNQKAVTTNELEAILKSRG